MFFSIAGLLIRMQHIKTEPRLHKWTVGAAVVLVHIWLFLKCMFLYVSIFFFFFSCLYCVIVCNKMFILTVISHFPFLHIVSSYVCGAGGGGVGKDSAECIFV